MTVASTQFVYLAMKPDGSRRFGMVRGRDSRHVTDQLRRLRLVPLKTWRLPAWASGASGGPSLKDQSELHLQLSQLLGRGVPLVEALDVTVGSVTPKTKPRVERMRELVASGSSFAEASGTAGMFDPVTVAVYKAAERTGDLGGAAKQLSVMSRRTLAIREKITTLMLYPVIVAGVSVCAGAFLLLYVVPKVGEAITDLAASEGKEIPWFTQIVMSFSTFLRDHWLWLLVALALVVGVTIALRGAIAGIIGALARKVPVLREVILASESARFFSVMTAMSRNGVPLADALAVVNTTIAHPELRSQLETLRQKLVDGGLLRQLLNNVTALPPATRRLLIAAERSGDMDQAFQTLAQDMQDDLDRRSARLVSVMEPALIIMVTAFVGTMLVSLLLPMFTMTSSLG